MDSLLDFFLHLDVHLEAFVSHYGPWVYGLLFLIIFAETGLVVTPFLPGDSLLFTAGALARHRTFSTLRLAAVLLLVAAILGDAVNYAVGHFVGPRMFRPKIGRSFWHRLLNRDHLMKAHAFFERHGGKAIVLGRFVPIVRTFVPFVAGCGSMSYPQFAFYNVAGGLLVGWPVRRRRLRLRQHSDGERELRARRRGDRLHLAAADRLGLHHQPPAARCAGDRQSERAVARVACSHAAYDVLSNTWTQSGIRAAAFRSFNHRRDDSTSIQCRP